MLDDVIVRELEELADHVVQQCDGHWVIEKRKDIAKDIVRIAQVLRTALAQAEERERALREERDKYKAMWQAVASGCLQQAARVWECDPNAPVEQNVEEAIDRLDARVATARAEALEEAANLLVQRSDAALEAGIPAWLRDRATAIRQRGERWKET